LTGKVYVDRMEKRKKLFKSKLKKERNYSKLRGGYLNG
jgi:hypothetical protein